MTQGVSSDELRSRHSSAADLEFSPTPCVTLDRPSSDSEARGRCTGVERDRAPEWRARTFLCIYYFRKKITVHTTGQSKRSSSRLLCLFYTRARFRSFAETVHALLSIMIMVLVLCKAPFFCETGSLGEAALAHGTAAWPALAPFRRWQQAPFAASALALAALRRPRRPQRGAAVGGAARWVEASMTQTAQTSSG